MTALSVGLVAISAIGFAVYRRMRTKHHEDDDFEYSMPSPTTVAAALEQSGAVPSEYDIAPVEQEYLLAKQVPKYGMRNSY